MLDHKLKRDIKQLRNYLNEGYEDQVFNIFVKTTALGRILIITFENKKATKTLLTTHMLKDHLRYIQSTAFSKPLITFDYDVDCQKPGVYFLYIQEGYNLKNRNFYIQNLDSSKIYFLNDDETGVDEHVS